MDGSGQAKILKFSLAWPGRPPGACQAAGQAGSSGSNYSINVFYRST